MGLTKRKDGWYVEFPVVDDGKVLQLARGAPGAKVKRWKTGTHSKTLAGQQEAMIKTDLMKGKITSERSKSVTFSQWAETYLQLEEVKSLRSYKDRVETVRYQLIPFFGRKELSDITAEDIENYRNQRKLRNGKEPSLQTINNDHTMLKHMLSVADRKGLLQMNVAKKVRMPDPKNERDRVLTKEEWERLVEAASPHIQPQLSIAYHLGMRLGEILKLTWDRVDLEAGFIKLGSRDTKTGDSRLVPMTPTIQQMLKELSKVKSLLTNRVFLYKGRAVGEIKTAVKTAIKRAGIHDFRFHDLRHCAATNFRRAGVDTVTAMKIVGHKSDKMHRRYNSVSEADLLNAVSQLNTLITPADSVVPAKTVSH
jgi:integrase